MTRAYQLKRRAERQDETRQRIVDATIELHQTVGPAATTMSDIAALAHVGRVTVYRHFPDEATLSRACSGQYFERHPVPDPTRWRALADPEERLRSALLETYAYHRATEAMISHVLADARDHPVMAPYHAHWQRAGDILLAPFRVRGRRRELLRAGIALALSFDTWRTLAREQQLSDEQAVELMLRLTSAGLRA
jgi:AcrR family transcriptional regulator